MGPPPSTCQRSSTCWWRTRSIASASAPSQLDLNVLLFARRRGHSPPLERVIAAYSRAGEHAGCWIALGLSGAALSVDAGRRRRWLRAVRVVAGSYVINYVVKITVRRRRPDLPGLPPLTPTVSRLSFPSAHATTSFAACRAFRTLVPVRVLYAAAGLFAISRPYLGVHYPSDVMAGAVLGTAVGELWPEGH